MALLNYSGKQINMYKFEDVSKNENLGIYIAKPGAKPFESYESLGVLNIYSANAEVGVQPLPDEDNNFITTQLYAIEAKIQGVGKGRVFVANEPVFSSSGEVIGCLSVDKFN